MKERPIIFTPENAQMIFEGKKKTQTRRVWKNQPRTCRTPGPAQTFENIAVGDLFICPDMFPTEIPPAPCGSVIVECENPGTYHHMGIAKFVEKYGPRAYGVVGDRLWVREAWADYKESTPSDDAGAKKAWESFSSGKKGIVEAAKDIPKPSGGLRALYKGDFGGAEVDWKWRNAMFMPRWACRTILEITDVRVQRVQEIDANDALAEGVQGSTFWKPKELEGRPFEEKWWDDYHFWSAYPQVAFQALWDSINAKTHPWKENPWVWAITFKKITGE